MERNIAKSLMLILLLAFTSNAQWIPMTSGIGKEIKCMTKSGSSLYVGTSDAGVYSSSISDTNWVQKNTGISNLKVYSIASNGNSLAIGTYGGGVFSSTDNGDNWGVKNSGLTLPYVYSIGFSGQNMMAGSGGYGIFTSTNAGANWSSSLVLSYIVNVFYVTDTVVYSGVGPYIYKSYDHGSTWNPVIVSNSTIKAFVIGNGGEIFVGSLDGMFLSTDNGATWSTINTGLIYRNVNALAKSGNTIFAATENGGLFSSSNNGSSWAEINTGLPASTSARAIIVDAGIMYIATSAGTIWKRNVSEVTSVSIKNKNLPAQFTLEQNYPNPFNPVTVISYQLPVASHVTLKVYDALGREIATLINENVSAGKYDVQFDASKLSSGLYFYTLHSANNIQTKKMLLTK